MSRELKGFLDFIKERGVAGLAIGVIFGGAVSKMITSLVTDILNPLISLVLGEKSNLDQQFTMIGGAKLAWGNFLVNLVDFLIIAVIVYYGIKVLRVFSPDKPVEKKASK